MSTTTTCSNCLLPLALAWGVGRGIFWTLMRKWCKFFHPDGPETLLAWTVSLYRHRGSKWHISYVRWHHVPVSVWCAWLDLVLKDNEEGAQACDAMTHMHRYMAVPRTPVQTDRLDTTEASAVYRATRDRQVIKGATRQMSYSVFQQGELHKSEKRATSSGG